MELQAIKTANALTVKATGRLNASRAEYFLDAFMEYIRRGEHQLVIDAAGMEFLSSAGIRSLMRIHKELARVEGRFVMINTNEFVRSTLETTGLGEWLAEQIPESFSAETETLAAANNLPDHIFLLDKDAGVKLNTMNSWVPWQTIQKDQVKKTAFHPDSFGLGIGSPVDQDRDNTTRFGDFLAVCGHVVYQPPDVKSRPDYLVPAGLYIPEMQAIQLLFAEGGMSHLLRFAPDDDHSRYPVSRLIDQALSLINAEEIAFVILGETDGLVGAYLTRSPAEKAAGPAPVFPEVREWLSFTGEPAFRGEQALIFGVAARNNTDEPLLKALPSLEGISAHMHAVVFPFQPLQNGKIDLQQQIAKLFNGPPPKALLHLIDDNRPLQGLGESSLVRGALWCAPVKEKEEQL